MSVADDFGAHLRKQAEKEVPDESLEAAKLRARRTNHRVNWNGHYVLPDGSLFAYNN